MSSQQAWRKEPTHPVAFSNKMNLQKHEATRASGQYTGLPLGCRRGNYARPSHIRAVVLEWSSVLNMAEKRHKRSLSRGAFCTRRGPSSQCQQQESSSWVNTQPIRRPNVCQDGFIVGVPLTRCQLAARNTRSEDAKPSNAFPVLHLSAIIGRRQYGNICRTSCIPMQPHELLCC